MKNLLLLLFTFALVSCASAQKEAEKTAPNNAPAAIKNDSEEWKLARWDEYKPARLQWLTNEKSLANTSRGNWRAVAFTTTDSMIASVMLEKNADRLWMCVDIPFADYVFTVAFLRPITVDEATLFTLYPDRVMESNKDITDDLLHASEAVVDKWSVLINALIDVDVALEIDWVTDILIELRDRGWNADLFPIHTMRGEYIGDCFGIMAETAGSQ